MRYNFSQALEGLWGLLVTHIVTPTDTSDVYGPFTNEELVGRAIKGVRVTLLRITNQS